MVESNRYQKKEDYHDSTFYQEKEETSQEYPLYWSQSFKTNNWPKQTVKRFLKNQVNQPNLDFMKYQASLLLKHQSKQRLDHEILNKSVENPYRNGLINKQ